MSDDFAAQDAPTSESFVNREAALSRVQKHLNDIENRAALTFISRNKLGKSALLKQIARSAGPHTISVYMPLKAYAGQSEADFLRALAAQTVHNIRTKIVVNEVNIISPPEDEDADLRHWFAEDYVPTVQQKLKQRRLLWLLDDAEQLLQITQADEPLTTYLAGLINARLMIVTSLDLRHENAIDVLAPLIMPENNLRLETLSLEASRQLLRIPNTQEANHLQYAIADETIAKIYSETGGEPLLLQHFMQHLYEISQNDKQVITHEEFRDARERTYADALDHFNTLWAQLGLNERLTLTAIAEVLHTKGLRAADTTRIEKWFINTDHPLDHTTISAAIRSLGYMDLVTGKASNVYISAGLMRRWLLENTRLTQEMKAIPAEQSESSQPRLLWLSAIMLALITLLVIILAIISDDPGRNDEAQPAPTVTLIADDR